MISLEFIINTLSLGSLYAMLALGLVIIYGILRLVNFAYGELIMIGGYTMFLLAGFTPLPWLVVAILAVAAAMFTSLFTELVAFRPVREKSLTAMLITSFAVSTLLQNAALLIISPRARAVSLPQIFQTSVMIAGTSVPWRNILTIVTSIVMLTLLTLLLRRTVLGIALRAAADNFTMTRMLGVPANTVISAAFAISGIMAGIVAIFWIGRSATVTPTIGAPPLLVAFVATVIGGMRSLTGAVVGGFVYAAIISLLGVLLPPDLLEFREAFMFAFVIIILLVRPQGLIRSKTSEERVG
ncbi:MAG TPA: branched-chain amino acid ABC transporter permease [Anaerolineales bacterium]|nr:branched-chain amino acid ABC transporter permease [Anaerolineales bacterium]